MVIFKITLTLTGKFFSPSTFINKINNVDIILDMNEPGARIWEDKEDLYDEGSISIVHPRIFGFQYDNWEYEKWFLQFMEDNYEFFNEAVEEINFFMEVYYSGDQCNFEIFNADILKKLVKQFNLSLPISIYHLSEKDIVEMLMEADFTIEDIEKQLKGRV